MRQTLFLIPHEWFQGPLLIAWLVVGALIFAFLAIRGGMNKDTLSFLPIYGIVAAVVWFVLPNLEISEMNAEGEMVPVGLAIRGYGFMMLLGMLSGMGLAMIRGRQLGVAPEKIISLCFWLVISGLVGARLLYVIQKWQRFEDGADLGSLIGSMVNMTEGGLVVYGSVIGAAIGGVVFLRISKLPILKMADIVAPGMIIGLALGRVGCLLNGCCYGSHCDIEFFGAKFPPEAPPYLRQLETGELLGIHGTMIEEKGDNADEDLSGWFQASEVVDGSIASTVGVAKGDHYVIQFDGQKIVAIKRKGYPLDGNVTIKRLDKPSVDIPIKDLPDQSGPTHPTQVYSAINAGLLCLVVWFYFPYRRYNGQVFGLLLILYSVTRFLLESIRTDELGFLGTPLTISQWISVFALVGGILLFTRTRSEIESIEQAKPATQTAG